MSELRDPFVLAYVLGVTPSKWIGVWRERMGSTPLSASLLDQAEVLPRLVDSSVHAALLRLPVDVDGLSTIPLYTERAVAVVPKDHSLEASESLVRDDLEGENLLSGDATAAIELVAANVGIAIMPQSVARALSRKDVVARFITDADETTIALVWRTDRTGPLIEEFIGIVRGRTANSSRGERPPTAAAAAPKRAVQSKRAASPQRAGASQRGKVVPPKKRKKL